MDTHLTDWVAYHARRFPDRIAVEDLQSGRSLTWSEFEARVARLAGALVDRFGIAPGDRVGVLAEDDAHVLEIQFACVRIGAIFVPFNWRLSPLELEVLVTDAEPRLLISDSVWQVTAAGLAESAGDVPLATWGCGDTPADVDAEIERGVAVAARRDHLADQVTQILYTSGTTGLPKGALITFGNMAWNALNVVSSLAVSGPPNRYLSALPLFHAAGLNAITNPMLMLGGTVSVLRRFDPERVAQLLGDPAKGYSHFCAAPVMFRLVAEAGDSTRNYAHVAGALVGGGAIEPGVGEYFSERGLELQSGWGATEMGPNSTVMPREFRARKSTTVGFPVQHVQLRVVDPATGNDVAPGEEGEAWVRGPSIISGYWRQKPEDTGHVDGAWFRSGDAVALDEDGFVALRGRYKDMYKSGGENVFAAEVERVLAEHAAVQDVAVIGVADATWGEVGLAVIVPRPGHTVDCEDVVAHCAGRLAKYKIPADVVVVESLPRNVTGKIQKNELRRTYASATLRG